MPQFTNGCFNCLRPDFRVSPCKFDKDQEGIKNKLNMWKEINKLDPPRATCLHTVPETFAHSTSLVKYFSPNLLRTISTNILLEHLSTTSTKALIQIPPTSIPPYLETFHSSFIASKLSPPFSPPPSSTKAAETIEKEYLQQPINIIMFTNEVHYDLAH